MRSNLAVLFCAFLLGVASPQVALSQVDFRISPPIHELSLGRGATKVFSFELANDNKEKPIQFKIMNLDLEMDREGAIDFREAGTLPHSCSSWVQVEPTTVAIGPGQTKRITGKISVPASASAGGYYGAIVCELSDRQPLRLESGAKIRWRIATLLKVTVIGGSVVKKADIVDFSLRTLFENPQDRARGVTFVAALQNQGNIHIQAEGKLTVLTPDRRRKGEADFDVGTGTILPGHTRDFTVVYDKLLTEGDYLARAVFRYGGSSTLEKEIPFSVKSDSPVAGAKADTVFLAPLRLLPERIKVSVPPGGFRTASLTIQNQRQEAADIVITPDPASIARSWLTIEPSLLSLSGGSEAKVLLRINIPAEAKPGTYATKLLLSPSFNGTGSETTERIEMEINFEIPDL